MPFRARTLLHVLPALLAVLAIAQSPAPRPDGLYARIRTSKGLIVAHLEMDRTPLTVANFVGLAEGTIANAAFDPGRPFFDGTVFHRVVPGHVIQTGSPQGGRGRNTGYTFPNEIHARLNHGRAGMLNMANAGPHTNSSQFCVTLGDRSYLDGDYTVFGDVVEGMDVVGSIVQGDVVQEIRIDRVGDKAKAFHPTTESFRALLREATERVAAHEEKKVAAEREWIASHYPKATGPSGGVLTERLAPGTAPSGAPLRVRYRGTALRYLGLVAGREGPPIEEIPFASSANGAPGHGSPEAFTVEPGKTRVNPGLDEAIAAMQPGERRIVFVPAALAYGRAGSYSPEVSGVKRFVISPNMTLVYDVEAMVQYGAQCRAVDPATIVVNITTSGGNMQKAISAADANRRFSELLRTVKSGESVMVTSHGKPVARIVPVAEEEPAVARARTALFARLRRERATRVGRWTRDELYDQP